MKRYASVDEYILNAKSGKEMLIWLRELLQKTELVETVKWGAPVYTCNGKNIVGIGAFKSYVGLWFFQGALLKDDAKVLINAQEDKTKALRQWHFTSLEEIDESLVLAYINEAIENHKQNKAIKPTRNKALIIPTELQNAFLENPGLEGHFKKFTTGKQREFADYISSAKQEKTKASRLQKIIPLIQQNIGLNDKYRK